MANILKHRFVSGKSDGPDPTQIQPSNWNDGHLFAGGNAGDLLTRDPTDPNYGAKWTAAPVVPPLAGQWIDVPFSGANFSWALDAGDQTTFGYALTGKMLTVGFHLDSTSVAGAPDTYLRIVIPGGYLPLRQIDVSTYAIDNGTVVPARMRVNPGVNFIYIFRNDFVAWAASTNNTFLWGVITFPIQ